MQNLSLRNVINMLFIFITFAFLNSCLTINSNMKLNSNGSGTITIQYTLERGLSGIANLGSDYEIVPLNLSEEFIIQMIGGRDDIEYKDYKISEDNRYYTVQVTFLFDNIDALNRILPEDNAVVLLREGSETIFKQGVVTQTDEEINDDSLEILKDIYKDHTFTFEVKVPGDIIDVDQGKKIDSRVALYHENFLEIITSNNKKEWSIRW